MQNRILIIRKYNGFGGIEHQIITISSGLVKSGWNVYFLSDKESPLSMAMTRQGCVCIIAPFKSMFNTAKVIVDICKANGIHIIQAHMFKEDICCRLAKIVIPNVKHYYRVHTYIDCSDISRIKKNMYHILAKITDCLVDGYLPINEMNRAELINRTHAKSKKIHIVHDATRKLDTKQGLFCPNSRRMAMIANFERGKGHDVLIEGIKLLKEQGEIFEVKLIGGNPGQGTEYEDFTVYNEVIGRIIEYGIEDSFLMYGYSNNIERDIKDCGFVVLPSDSEGTPNCLLEGMLLKKIIIASDVGGIPEFVKDGKTGFLHKAGDAKDFAVALMRAKETPEAKLEQMVNEAFLMVKNGYSRKIVVNELVSEYSG